MNSYRCPWFSLYWATTKRRITSTFLIKSIVSENSLFTIFKLNLKSLEWIITLREKCLYSELLWSTFFRIRTEYGEMRSIRARITLNTDTLYAVQVPHHGSHSQIKSLNECCPHIETSKSINWILYEGNTGN